MEVAEVVQEMAVFGCKICTPTEVYEEGVLTIESGQISGIKSDVGKARNRVDARGYLALPGIVDIHCDALEDRLYPHPGARIPPDLALAHLDRELAMYGITTEAHALSFEDPASPRRSIGTAHVQLNAIRELRKARASLITHLVTARCELTDEQSPAVVTDLMGNEEIVAVSLGDHAPDPERYGTLEKFRRYCAMQLHMDDDSIDALVKRKLRFSSGEIEAAARRVANAARDRGVVVFADGDRTKERLKYMNSVGATVSIFPRSVEVAHYAKELKMMVCAGAPNVMLGGSHKENVATEELASQSLLDLLCSDYHPPSMLAAVLNLANAGLMPMHEAVNLVSLNPARLVGRDKWIGAIQPGRRADLILVDGASTVPVVAVTLVAGEIVFRGDHHRGP